MKRERLIWIDRGRRLDTKRDCHLIDLRAKWRPIRRAPIYFARDRLLFSSNFCNLPILAEKSISRPFVCSIFVLLLFRVFPPPPAGQVGSANEWSFHRRAMIASCWNGAWPLESSSSSARAPLVDRTAVGAQTLCTDQANVCLIQLARRSVSLGARSYGQRTKPRGGRETGWRRLRRQLWQWRWQWRAPNRPTERNNRP